MPNKNIEKKEKSLKKKIIKIILMFLLLIIVLIITYQIVTWKKEYYICDKNIDIPIFLYHDIVENKEEIEYDYMQTDKKTFENQIKGLKNFGYTVITYEQLQKYSLCQIPLPKHSCIIDFDDGYKGNYENALETIQKYNVPINIYVIDDCIGTEGYMDWNEIKELDKTGLVTINSHGKTHYDFSQEPTEKAVEDVKYAHKQIEKNLEKEQIKVFTYPYGLSKEETVEQLEKEGFIQNLTDNKINKSENLNLSGLHRCYCLNDSIFKILLKVKYRSIKYN